MMQLLIILFTIVSFNTMAQMIGTEVIDESKVLAWNSTGVDYQGVYHFGESEGESELVVVCTNNRIYAQIKSGSWSADGKSWIFTYDIINNATLQGNKFRSETFQGDFVYYDDGTEKIKGLKVFDSWSGVTEKGQYEIGTRTGAVSDYFPGKFSKASYQKLTAEDLIKFTKSDLQIMRNEIYARYGLIFKAGGAMDNYFKLQEWYQPQHNVVDSFLTDLERENIVLIQHAEGSKP